MSAILDAILNFGESSRGILGDSMLFYTYSWTYPEKFSLLWAISRTCLCGRMVYALGRHVQYRATQSMAGIRLGRARPPTKNYF